MHSQQLLSQLSCFLAAVLRTKPLQLHRGPIGKLQGQPEILSSFDCSFSLLQETFRFGILGHGALHAVAVSAAHQLRHLRRLRRCRDRSRPRRCRRCNEAKQLCYVLVAGIHLLQGIGSFLTPPQLQQGFGAPVSRFGVAGLLQQNRFCIFQRFRPKAAFQSRLAAVRPQGDPRVAPYLIQILNPLQAFRILSHGGLKLPIRQEFVASSFAKERLL
mmetsp:Transcript_72845/g.160812  ORF Transcript_72845/g.160812 Transcript_72845/m.160812 type:complete len:216 (+) Transcript_72845:406-1053(+)